MTSPLKGIALPGTEQKLSSSPDMSHECDVRGNLVLSRKSLRKIKELSFSTPKKRSRICAHPNPLAPVHEMLIGFHRDSYIRPHRHTHKTESFHIIQGEIEVIFFNEHGKIQQRVPMGPYNSGKNFFLRYENHDWHTVIIQTEYALIHETTNGPFDPSETEYAPWSPEPEDQDGVAKYMQRLRELE